MRKGTMVNGKLYREKVKPFFNAMGWEMKTTALPPEDNIIIHSVTRPKLGGGREPLPEIIVRDVVGGCLNETGADTEQEAAESTLLENIAPISAVDFLMCVKPYFDGLEWTLSYRVTETGSVVVIDAVDRNRDKVDEDTLLDAVRGAAPGLVSPEIADGPRDADGAAKAFMDIPDYTKIREDPGNDGLMKEYADQRLTIHRDDLTETVKPAFVDRAWIYSGEHYGDGSVQIQAVVNKKQRVISLETVCRILDDLDVRYDLKPPEADLETEERNEVPIHTFPRLENTSDEDLEIGERSQESSTRMDLIAKEAAAAIMKQKETEEAEEGAGGVLVLEEGEPLFVKICKYSPETERTNLSITIGDNIIFLQCDFAQLRNFVASTSNVWDAQRTADEESEKAKEPTDSVLVLTDEDVMDLCAVYLPRTERVAVELHLASNVIAVECSQAQFTNFFNGAQIVVRMLAAYETGNTEEATKDERCESEDNSGQ